MYNMHYLNFFLLYNEKVAFYWKGYNNIVIKNIDVILHEC